MLNSTTRPLNSSTPIVGSRPVNPSTPVEICAGWLGAHSRLPAAHRGECTPYSRRCACGEPKRPIESACKPCRLRRLADNERARVETALNFVCWERLQGDL